MATAPNYQDPYAQLGQKNPYDVAQAAGQEAEGYQVDPGFGQTVPSDYLASQTGAVSGPGSSTPKTNADPYALWQQYSKQNPNANIQGLIDYFNQNGVQATRATHANGTLPSDDKAIVNGQMIDFIGDAGGANTWQYNVEQPGGAGGGGAVAPGGYSYAAGQIPAFNVLDPRVNDLYNTLLGRSQQSLTPNAHDPIIAAQTNAYGAQQQRGVRDYLAAEAEQQGPNANLGAERRLANEHAAQATGSLQASVMQNELNARRSEIQNALTQMGSMLSDQQKLALSQELGNIDANLRQQAINSGNDQFAATYGLNSTQQANYWDALRSGLING